MKRTLLTPGTLSTIRKGLGRRAPATRKAIFRFAEAVGFDVAMERERAERYTAATGRPMPRTARTWRQEAARYGCPHTVEDWEHDGGKVYDYFMGKATAADQYYPARHYRGKVTSDDLRQAVAKRRVAVRPPRTAGNPTGQNQYCDADVRRVWPHRFSGECVK